MPKKGRAKVARSRPDPRDRGSFYLLEVTSFFLSGGAATWRPDELPQAITTDYLKTPNEPVLHEDLGLYLQLRPLDPPMREVREWSLVLSGGTKTPEPDFLSFGGLIQMRKKRVHSWFRASSSLVRDLAPALLVGQRLYLQLQGARIYRGKALLCGIEWWTHGHPDLQAELEALGIPAT